MPRWNGAWASDRPATKRSGRGGPTTPAAVTPPPGGYRLLVLVGIPGSGKSTFASFLTGMGWVAVNQDSLGSRRKCEIRTLALLRRGRRVIVDRCNIDASQRAHWIGLAVEASLHENACAAIWLDVPLEICQHRVRDRVGHPSLGGPSAPNVVARFANGLNPPRRTEGFHLVLRCRGDHDLSEGVSLLSDTGNRNTVDVPAANGNRSMVDESAHSLGAAAVGSGGSGGGGGGSSNRRQRRMARGHVSRPYLPPRVADTVPSYAGGGNTTSNGTAVATQAPAPVSYSGWNGVQPHNGCTLSPVQSAAGGRTPSPRYEGWDSSSAGLAAYVGDARPALGGRGGGAAGYGGGGDDDRRMPVSSPSHLGEVHLQQQYDFPLLPARLERYPADSPRATWQLQTWQSSPPPPLPPPPPPPLPPPPTLPPPSDCPVISAALLSPTGGTHANDDAGRASHSELHPSPLTNDGGSACGQTDLREGVTTPEFVAPDQSFPHTGDRGGGNGRGGGSRCGSGWNADNNNHVSPASGSAAATRNAHGVPSLSPAPSSDYGSGEAGYSTSSWGSGQETRADGAGKGGAPASSGGQAAAAATGLDLSEGEAFALLEDMFGGLLPPPTLEKVFACSGEDLEEAVKQGFQACEDLWVGAGSGDDFCSSLSSAALSDCATTTDDSLCSGWSPSASGGAGSCVGSSNCGGFDVQSWEGSEAGFDLAELSEWTREQVDALTEVSLAFGGVVDCDQIVAALVATEYNPLSAAQLLLETQERDDRRHKEQLALTSAGSTGGKKRSNKKASQQHRKRTTRILQQQQQAGAEISLGSTCANRRAGKGGRATWGAPEDEGGLDDREEEEGDEGLSSDEYRTRADAAAMEMKVCFQKAAEAFTRGGRNGGAAASHPSQEGQKWRREMDTLNLRAARETFRERNPKIRVGPATDGCSVLTVLALPRPSQCPTRGQLSVDLHLLRRAEAVNVVEAILAGCGKNQKQVLQSTMLSIRYSSPTAVERVATSSSSSGAEHGRREESLYSAGETFSSLEVVVGRGAHSSHGVARLRPVVGRYLARKGFPTRAVSGEKGEGVIVVELGDKLDF